MFICFITFDETYTELVMNYIEKNFSIISTLLNLFSFLKIETGYEIFYKKEKMSSL